MKRIIVSIDIRPNSIIYNPDISGASKFRFMMKIRKAVFFLFLGLTFVNQAEAQWWHFDTPLIAPIVNNPIVRPGYKLIFNDEFNSQSFNYSCWERGNYFHGEELQLYVDDHAHQANEGESNYEWGNGTLNLVARHGAEIPETMRERYNSETDLLASEYDFTSAWFESNDMFKHGFFEMRAKLPRGARLWPAFWLFHTQGDIARDGSEIDIFEIFGDALHMDGTNIYFSSPIQLPNYDAPGNGCTLNGYGQYPYSLQQDIEIETAGSLPDFSQDFFTYGLEWSGNRIEFYLNNHLVRIIEDCNVPESFMKVIANLAVAHFNFHNSPSSAQVDPLDFPASFEIDYIRVYKKIEVDNFGYNPEAGGWRTNQHRRLIGDINGDGKDDIVGFGNSQVIAALGMSEFVTGAGFHFPHPTISNFCVAQGWNVDDHPVYLADINGDGKDDIIGFGYQGVYVALSNTSASATIPTFLPATLWLNQLGNSSSAGGYHDSTEPRTIGDINGDGMTDVVAFSNSGVRVAFSTGSGFTPSYQLINHFGSDANAGGWNTSTHRRFVADVTGDGKDDIVGFGHSNVVVAQSLGTSFATEQSTISEFCSAQGWDVNLNPIYLADLNADGRKDIVGFGGNGVYASVATQSGIGFTPSVLALQGYFGNSISAGSWDQTKHIRMVGDINGDGRTDIVGFGSDGVYISRANPFNNTFTIPEYTYNEYGYDATQSACLDPWMGSWRVDKHPRTLADFNGDGNMDVIAFGDEGVFGHISAFNCDASNAQKREPETAKSPKFVSSDFSVFPNPNEGSFLIELEKEAIISIYGTDGRLVKKASFYNPGLCSFDLHTEPNGVYLLKVKQKDDVTIVKVMKN